AHVRRYDYLVNLVQSVIETLLFYHPAVWWVSQQVREEREHCCDDLAVAVCGDAHLYATALVGMERLRGTPPAFALAATGRGGASVGALLEIARTHPDPGVRRKAVKTVGEVATPEAALGVLERLAQRDPDVEVQQEAVEALGHLGTPQVIAPLARLARAQPNAEVRDEAVEQYARSAAPESALVLLVDRLANDSSSDVQMEAVERLADLPDGLGIPALR